LITSPQIKTIKNTKTLNITMTKQREKKTFSVTLDEELVKEFERRAKRDYLTLQELINKILWRSARSSLRRKRNPRPRKADNFIEVFSRQQPLDDSVSSLYDCKKCKSKHRYSSDIGKRHIKFKK
jgi:metal-responsive CopG/Arc/MetJ family transcriptional regulator